MVIFSSDKSPYLRRMALLQGIVSQAITSLIHRPESSCRKPGISHTPRTQNEKRRLTCATKLSKGMEAAAGVEPAHKGFADLCLTTWLRRLRICLSSNCREERRAGNKGFLFPRAHQKGLIAEPRSGIMLPQFACSVKRSALPFRQPSTLGISRATEANARPFISRSGPGPRRGHGPFLREIE